VTNQKRCKMQMKQDIKIPFDKHNTDKIKGNGKRLNGAEHGENISSG
jgi:hypothetical protein